MKILHIIDSSGLYGAEAVLLNLVDEQIKMGLNPTIASIGEKHISEKEFETEALKRGFELKKFRMRAGPNYLGALKILRFAHLEGFDLIHTHGYKGNILFGFMPKKFRRFPLVCTLHGWTSCTGITKLRLYEWLDSMSLRFFDAVILVDKSMLSKVVFKRIAEEKIFIVNNGISLGSQDRDSKFCESSNLQAKEAEMKTIKFCMKGFTIGAIGRLSQEKAFGNLIEAFKLVSVKRDNVRLIIVGEGPERKFLEQKIEKLMLQYQVLLPGYLNDAKKYFPFFDIYVLCSVTEGFPITILEAMNSGVPILSTKVGGIPALLGYENAGLLVDPNSIDALAEGILKLSNNVSLAKRLAVTAKKIVKEKYSSKRMVLQYFDIYKHILSKFSLKRKV